MSDIFISYANEDPSRAEMLAQILEGHGWSVFWDRTIPPGKVWREMIGRELDDARCVIVLWNKASIKSGWVQDEADDAKRRGILVPILIENVQPPIGFRNIQAVHLIDWDGTGSTPTFRRLIENIGILVGRPPKADGEAEDKSKGEKERERDYREAENEKAAKGDEEAMNNLGALYETGHGVAQDYAKAREWYEKAAARGNANAMYNLGRHCDRGHGLAQDYVKAREWYEKAAARGNASAMNNLGALYENGHGVAQDYAEARGWYEKAAAKGNVVAMNNLGTLYDDGHGVAQDYAKAREWYEKAADKGNADAKTRLRQMPNQ